MAQVWLGILAGVILSDAAAHALAGKSVSFRVPTVSRLAGIFLEEQETVEKRASSTYGSREYNIHT